MKAQSLIYLHTPAKAFGSLHERSEVLGDGVCVTGGKVDVGVVGGGG